MFVASLADEGKWHTGGGTERQAQQRAVQSAWAFTAISFVARGIGAANLQIVEHKGVDEEPVQIPNHPLETLLRRPNPWMGGAFLWQYTAWWIELSGNAYWYVSPDNTGQPAEIWPLPARDVEPRPGDEEQFIDHYQYRVGGCEYDIPASNIVHFKLPNPFDMFRGMSPLAAAILGVDTDLAMAQWNARFFGRDNVMPSAVINLSSGDPSSPIEEADIEALKDDLKSGYQAGKRKVAITSAAKLEVELLGWNPKDLDFVQGRQFTKEEIYEVYGLPGGLLDKNATYANSANAEMVFNNKTVWPLLSLMAEQLTAELVSPIYGSEYEAVFEDVRQTNREQELQEIAAGGPYLTIDEVRAKYWRLDPLPEGRGKQTSTEAQGMGETGGSGFPGEDILAGGNGREAQEIFGGGGRPPMRPRATEETRDLRSQLADEDLRRWRTKSLNALRRGRPLPLMFRSDTIPTSVRREVIRGLAVLEAQSAVGGSERNADDVRGVFEEVSPLPPSPLKAPRGRSARPWDRWEHYLRGRVRRLLQAEGERLIKEVREKGEGAIHDEEFWDAHRAGFFEALQEGLLQLARLGVRYSKHRLSSHMAEMVDWDLVNLNAANWASQQAAQLVTNVTETTRQRLREDVTDWIQRGEALPGLERRIAETLADPKRAELVASTEATAAYAAGNDIAWTAAGVEPAAYKPPAHPRCILPGNIVAVPGLIAGAKSFYVGGVIEICTERGRRITVTKNHPILTEHGWVAAYLINEGDQVLVCADAQRVASSVYSDYDHVPAAIEEVFSTLEVSGLVSAHRVPIAPEYLHTDARFVQDDIEVIGPNRLLLDDVETRLAELVRQHGLNGDNTRAPSLTARGVFAKFFPGDDAPSGSVVRGADLGSTSGGGHLRPLEHFSFGAAVGDNLSVQQPFVESSSVDTSFTREFVLRFASDIATEQVVEVRNFDVACHVYDLQSELYQLYTANGVIVKNCRCWLQPHKMPDGTWVMVWYTARDDLVCTQPLDTPWGTKKGCREMHKMIVSKDQYGGKRA